MSETTAKAWVCDECGYIWLKVAGRTPTQCPSTRCRSRKWDAKTPKTYPGALTPPTQKDIADRVAALNKTRTQTIQHHPTCRCARCGPIK